MKTTYERYMDHVLKARLSGITPDQIINELRQEIVRIKARCIAKSVELAGNKSPYPGREARRAATECIAVIERIIKELDPKEIKV